MRSARAAGRRARSGAGAARAEGGTRTLTPVAQEPKSCVSTSSTTPAGVPTPGPLTWYGSDPQVPAELVDVAGGLDVVLRQRDPALARLVHVQHERRAEDAL